MRSEFFLRYAAEALDVAAMRYAPFRSFAAAYMPLLLFSRYHVTAPLHTPRYAADAASDAAHDAMLMPAAMPRARTATLRAEATADMRHTHYAATARRVTVDAPRHFTTMPCRYAPH